MKSRNDEEKSNNVTQGKIDYDRLWGNLIKDLFNEIIAFFAPNLYDDINFSKKPKLLQFKEDKILSEEQCKKGYVNQLFEIQLKDKTMKWILLHIDTLNILAENLPRRLFHYFNHIHANYQMEIHSIVLITDPSKPEPKNYYLHNFHETHFVYMYQMYKFDEENLVNLRESTNPFAHAIVAAIYKRKYQDNLDQLTAKKNELLKRIASQYSDTSNQSKVYLEILTSFVNHLHANSPKGYFH